MHRDWIGAKMKKYNFFTRIYIQIAAVFASNPFLQNFSKGTIYQGKGKGICVPGLNCYSCPAAVGACPLGSLQSSLASPQRKSSFYIAGFLVSIGAFFGRTICSFLCPFGFLQELLYKIPTKKIKKSNTTRRLSIAKYIFLVVFVLALPYGVYLATGIGSPFFCKLICPAGSLEAGIPLVIANKSLQSLVGFLFSWKMSLLALFIITSIFIYRPFCRFVCPLGAIYSFFNKYALFGVRVDTAKCISCKKCINFCKLDVHEVNDRECIRCGECISVCPTEAISFFQKRTNNNTIS
jgi:polyferredoxin